MFFSTIVTLISFFLLGGESEGSANVTISSTAITTGGYSSSSLSTLPTSDITSTYDNSTANSVSPTNLTILAGQSRYTLFQIIVIAWVACCFNLLTVIGNILVMVSFKIDKQLQTISNYFLLSLAVADFVIGSLSMPFFTIYLLLGYWPFGTRVCDLWLAIDYLVSNASVLNLLIISFDRYFSVTRPLTYRARRTTKRAAVMISSAWGISLIMWPPWIYAWPYIEGKRTVPELACYIQFIETNHYITFGTAIAAFYVPVSIMLILYYQIWRETEKRQRDLSQLQAGKKDSSRRSNSSDEAVDVEEWRKMRSESCICQDHLDINISSCPAHHRQSSLPRWFRFRNRWRCLASIYLSCVRFCKVDRDMDGIEDDLEDEHANSPAGGCGTPASIETPLQSSVSRCTSLNVIRDPLAQTPIRRNDSIVTSGTIPSTASSNPISSQQQSSVPGEGSNGKLPSSDSVYTILIRIPQDTGDGKNASIRMIQEPGPLPPLPVHPKAKIATSASSTDTLALGNKTSGPGSPIGRRASAVIPPLNAKIITRPISGGGSKGSTGALSSSSQQNPVAQKRIKKKKNTEKKQEKKAAKTLSAILLAFIVTWTPYNILVLIRTFSREDIISPVLWDMAYYLCYINSTINPMCYALCNASFRRTYVRILTCKWDNSRRQAVDRGRGYYN